ncbi:cap-specific mRNA (nucleoside-2'-O-)-methyltransferase 2 [Latimeria chalumnae]|uniref:cap-specific mRNA (nucleoside-2'-O-)-methyltransferase 2 n=1 Tax=Latimeria chalumnae TaxID=7897 RepID=UPI0003C18239|nr:PREDICTED: cap-specific mRNA (nucleoside-2'-O-)-methyltransferase 2 [Latimeria chalumnae]XP_006010695.1 PREDICTED: cap-specific mRNA (nucleoside-2'-O-)-methyltransferase 2 [Latimeria chalumnae]XP_014352975.1 PREDICTED: cap-specific mRNA (nucleoside-2'-O-)-methyltransferase 2 [Latimeria chalumnae]|eukprot:XP_006010694.1 PREDICTED: cap-specific mRNA (nucleoside-2'-O-)-methyltransferase 2 [Latimeria chalumnae]
MNVFNKSRKKPRVEHFVNLNEFNPDVLSEISELFNKKFTYRKPPGNAWKFPEVSEVLQCEHAEFYSLCILKESLNEVKNKLSDKKLEEWHQHTSFTNKAGKVIPHVRRVANAELCTQAWCKFHEILCTFPLLPVEALQNGELNSVHLCEAPGAFIASLNHYLKSHHLPCDWNWVANTLNPYHEANDNGMMIMDDRLMANTLLWWYFGPDDTGDIMTLKHLTGLQDFISNMQTVHLITADGSFDCQGNPGEQEALVAPLHYCETVTALMLLSHSGSFVLKMFTMFEHSSVNLLFLLNCCFEEVHIFKPATSKAGNSEVYLICLKFLGKKAVESLLCKLVQNFGTDIAQKALFPAHLIPDSFLRQHEECCMAFYKFQTETINENLRLFDKMDEADQERLNTLRDCASEFFLQKFQVRHIPRNEWLLKKSHPGCSLNSKLYCQRNNKYCGTYNERKELESLAWKERVLKGCFSGWADEHILSPAHGGVLKGSPNCADFELWYILEGKKLPKVKSSAFCDVELINNLNEAITECILGRPESNSIDVSSLPVCPSCLPVTEEMVISELSNLIKSHREGSQDESRCLVVGIPSLCNNPHVSLENLVFLKAASCPPRLCNTLHDGEPRYQQQLLNCMICSFLQLRTGDSLVLPVLSSFTRFTAGLLFVLHFSFQLLKFSCPVSSGPLGCSAVLVCCGYRPLPGVILRFLQGLSELQASLLESESPQQVLQFVPMETLLKGALPEFLWGLNTAIAKHKLHVIVQAEQQQQLSTS